LHWGADHVEWHQRAAFILAVPGWVSVIQSLRWGRRLILTDNLPGRLLGVFGIGLILCGFALQSFQYWLVLFDVHLT
jgi:hypothetical protein